MKTSKFFAVVVGLCLMFLAATSFAQDAALKVAGFEGKVMVRTGASGEWKDAVVDQALGPKDAVKTGDNGLAMLIFSDKSSVALKPNSEVTVEDLAWNETARKAGLNMSAGEMRVIIKKVDAPSDFKVRTPTAICGARGTIFYVIVTATGTRVFVTEGAVDFTSISGDSSYVVVENMSALAEITGVSEPRELTGEDRERALAGWGGVIAETYTPPAGGEGGPAGDVPPGGGPEGDFQGGTPENPGQDNRVQEESPASPI